MEDRNQELIRQYHIKIYNTYRIRGAFILETDKGLKLLKTSESSKNRVEFENSVLEYLYENHYPYVDRYMRNIAGELLTEDNQGNKYVLKDWYPGEECNLREEEDVLSATRNLASIHQILRNLPFTEEQVEMNKSQDLPSLLDKRTRELKRVRSYIKEKRKKNEFEICYINCYEPFYEQALEAIGLLNVSEYNKLENNAKELITVCHGSYTYHNIVKINKGQSSGAEYLQAAALPSRMFEMATNNFDKSYVGIQLTDLYHFIRKVMEKNDWDTDMGSMILDAYENILPMSKEEQRLLYIYLLYPEKFWKIANFYYNGKKTWIPGRNIQKLVGIQEQMERKQEFLDCMYHSI